MKIGTYCILTIEAVFYAVKYIDTEQRFIAYTDYNNGTVNLYEENDVVAHGASVNINCETCTCLNGNLECSDCTCSSCLRLWEPWTACPQTCDAVETKRYQYPKVYGKPQWDSNCSEPRVEDCPIPEGCQNSDALCFWSTWGSWTNCTSTDPCKPERRERIRSCSCGVSSLCSGTMGDLEIKLCPSIGTCSACSAPYVLDACGNQCGIYCKDLSFTEECSSETVCEPKCICPSGFFLDSNGTNCVNQMECDCFYKGEKIISGQSRQIGCKVCTCYNGLVSYAVLPDCEECIYSEWTAWSDCVGTCGVNGVSTRKRELLDGTNCTNSEENKSCKVDCGFCVEEIIKNGTIKKYKINIDTCQLRTEQRFISDETGDCVSLQPVTISYCDGLCGRQTMFPVLSFGVKDIKYKKRNLSCDGDVVSMESATALCSSGKKWDMYYPAYSNCRCTNPEE